MLSRRPPSLPRWAWPLLVVWGPGVLAAVGASGYRPPLGLARTLLLGAVLSAWAYLGAVALRRLLIGAAALGDRPYVVRHAGLIVGASVGAAQLADKVPPVWDAPLAQVLAAMLLHGTFGLPFALWGGAMWQAGMQWFFRNGPKDPAP